MNFLNKSRILVSIVLLFSSTLHATPSKEEESLLIKQMDNVFSILNKYNEQIASIGVSVEESKKQAKEEIAKIRYEGENYFLIIERNGTIISHINKRLIGRSDLLNFKDPSGIQVFKKLITSAENHKAGGFFTYHWLKVGNPLPLEKLSYSRLFKEWNWVIGTSIYTKSGERESYIRPITITLSLIELYRLNKGHYPEKLYDLREIGKWVTKHFGSYNFQYKANGNGYDLFLINDLFPDGVKVLPNTMKKGLGIRNNNIFNS